MKSDRSQDDQTWGKLQLDSDFGTTAVWDWLVSSRRSCLAQVDETFRLKDVLV